jgi:hypothetical protein
MAAIPPWERNTSDDRHEDTLRTFIIFCEDDNSEPLYFRSFSNDKVQINAVPNQRQGKLNLLNAIQKCREDGLIAFVDNRWQASEGIREKIWCVYDRDLEHTDWNQIPQQHHLDFDLAIQTATQSDLRVAWSNDVFELWILLHFEDVPHGQIRHREYIYGRLTEIFKTLQPRTAELDRITGNPRFDYKTSFKKREYFLTHILPRLKTNTAAAIARAQQLEEHFNAQIAFHLRNPCTQVHHLVSEILA